MTKPFLRIEYPVSCSHLSRAFRPARELPAALAPSVPALGIVPAGGSRYRVSLGETELLSEEREGRFGAPEEVLKKAFAVIDATGTAPIDVTGTAS
jgi:predicted Rdx family selenoprotein